jgi:tetratricopeptide (TPR) repeat protein
MLASWEPVKAPRSTRESWLLERGPSRGSSHAPVIQLEVCRVDTVILALQVGLADEVAAEPGRHPARAEMIETKVPVGERGAYRATGAVENIHVPATVVPLTLLQAVAAVPEDMLRAALARLQAAEFLYEAALFPEVEYTFKHGLTYQVAYGSLLHERRRHLHAKATDALEQLAAGRVSEHVERLAHHAQRGELWERAVAYLRQAGAKALARSASREAAAAFEQALAALAHLPEGRATVEQAIDLRFELRQALQALGEHQRVVDYLREAEALAATLDDQRRMGWVSAYLSQYYAWLSEPARAAEAGHRALSIGGAGGDFGLQVVAHFFLGQLALGSGDYQRAKEHLRWNIDALTGNLVRERFGLSGLPPVLSRTNLILVTAELGEFTEGAAYADESVRIAESVGQPYSLIAAYMGLAAPHLAKGDAERALPPLERALALCETWNLAFFFPIVAQRLGSAYARVGRLDEAVPLLERAIARIPVLFRNQQALFHTALGEAYLLAGRLDEADEEARRALTLISRTRCPIPIDRFRAGARIRGCLFTSCYTRSGSGVEGRCSRSSTSVGTSAPWPI